MTKLGRSDIEVGRLGLGCAGLGNLYSAIDDETASATVDAAWDSGIRYFDTAPHYGLGLSERRLGTGLANRPRDEFVVSTKVGRLIEPNPVYDGSQRDDEGFDVPAKSVRRWDLSATGVHRSLESSLERLGLDRIDFVLIHDPEQNLEDPEQGLREAAPALARLRDDGVIRGFGVGTRSIETLERFVREASVDAVMLAGRYTLLNQDALGSLLPACTQFGVSVLNVGVFNSGLLARRRPAEDARFDYLPASAETLAKVRAIADVADEFGTTVPRAALEFALSHPTVVLAAIGASSPGQAVSNAALLDEPAPPTEFWSRLVELELLPSDVLARTQLS
jgi:D-threo-aldose 1-dehydrogenase